MTKADYIVVAFAVTLLPFLFITYWVPSARGDTAHILAAGAKEIKVSLDVDQRLDIEGPLGTSVIEIHQGKVRFVDSPCRGKQCIHSGWLQKTGDFAACLPNHNSIAVIGQELRYDTINF